MVQLPTPLGGGQPRPSSGGSNGRGGGGGIPVLVGSRRLMEEQGVAVTLAAAEWARESEGRGYTCVFVAGSSRYCTLIKFSPFPAHSSSSQADLRLAGFINPRTPVHSKETGGGACRALRGQYRDPDVDNIVILTFTISRYKPLAALAVADLVEPKAAGVAAALQESWSFPVCKASPSAPQAAGGAGGR